jgi:hypothetical protein
MSSLTSLNFTSRPRLLAKNTYRFARALKPLHETCGVKSVVTSLAFQVGHLMGLDAEDRVANRTWLHAIKFFVNILFP